MTIEKGDLWLILQIADSAFPTGGFVSSSGLEAYFHDGKVYGYSGLLLFMRQGISSYARQTLAFVRDSYMAKSNLDRILDLDKIFTALLNANSLVKQTSRSQGRAFLSIIQKSFLPDNAFILALKDMINKGDVTGHLSIVFGACMSIYDIPVEDCQYIFLFLYARSVVSAAVRLNIVGPIAAQKLLMECRNYCKEAMETFKNLDVNSCAQNNPLMDLMQGKHAKLYSRLFNS